MCSGRVAAQSRLVLRRSMHTALQQRWWSGTWAVLLCACTVSSSGSPAASCQRLCCVPGCVPGSPFLT